MTATVVHKKVSEAENKILIVTVLVKETDCNVRISKIEKKYFTISSYKKFKSDIIDAKIEHKKSVNKSNISNFQKISELNTKLEKLATKAELKAKQDKKEKVVAFDSSYSYGKSCFGNDGFQNMFVY